MTQKSTNSSTDRSPESFFTGANAVVIYTVFSILRKMQETLGLEAMLDYLQKYVALTETKDPNLKDAVGQALQLMSIEKIYREIISYGDEDDGK